MSRLVNNSLALVLAVSWLGGLLLFPRALEPGRADLNGIELNLLVDRGDGRTQNDWFSGSPVMRTQLSESVLRVKSHNAGFQILSRPLPVFADECYAVAARGRVSTDWTSLFVTDEELRQTLGMLDLSPSAADTEWRLVFDSGGERRITVVFTGEQRSVLELERVSLIRLGRRSPCA